MCDHTNRALVTTESVWTTLGRLIFRPSAVDFGWEWGVDEVHNRDGSLRGWLVSTTFRRPDTDTGVTGVGRGRQEYIAVGTTVSGLVKTCWLLAELIVRHELMEAFCFDGKRVFDPHKTVEQLTRDAR